jgi:hypothetical protein
MSMPLDFRIDHDQRTILATATGTLTDEDVFAYQREVWSRKEVAGFDEIVDLGAVEKVVVSSGDRVRALADLASNMDVPGTPSRLAIVAPQDFAYGMARMFETYRSLTARGSKAVSVFRSMQAALDWLGLQSPGGTADGSPSGPRSRG